MRLSRIYIIILIIYGLPGLAFAQQEFTVNGVLYRKSSGDRIAQATVTNMRNQVIMMSDELGGFKIKAAKGDTLVVNRIGYTPQTEVVTGPADMLIYMQPIITLNQVTIKDKSTQQELNDVINTYRSKGLYFDGKPPLSLFSPFGGSPITGFYELFSRDASNERRFIAFSKNEIEAITVDKRYTKQFVKQVTALSDSDVVKFMQQYRPSYEDMKEWNDYELIAHVKKYLIYFNQHKDGIPEQKLY